jgi:hypothetical protein
MHCPVCGNAMKVRKVEGITVDVCEGGCGGLWFDRFELQKVDDSKETAGEALLDVDRDPFFEIDAVQQRLCPSCRTQPMLRHFHSVKRQVMLDECPRCGGFWLDAGELGQMRHLFASEDEQRQAAREAFSEIFDEQLALMSAESEEQRRKARRIAHLFRFLCPSYYIPGKQDWGAF